VSRILDFRYTVSSAVNTAVTVVPAPALPSVRIYVTDIELGRTDNGTGSITVTLNDSAGTVLVVPGSAGGGINQRTFSTPLSLSGSAALTFTVSVATSTVYCNVQGYYGQ